MESERLQSGLSETNLLRELRMSMVLKVLDLEFHFFHFCYESLILFLI